MIYQIEFYFRKSRIEPFVHIGGLLQFGIEQLTSKFKNKSIFEIIRMMFPEYEKQPLLFQCKITCDFKKSIDEFNKETDARITYAEFEDLEIKLATLTKRETSVLKLMQQGFSIEQISDKLDISVSTVKGHQQKTYDVFGIHKGAALVLLLNSNCL